MRRSRIRPLRRALLRLAMWRDPEAQWPEDGEAEACFKSAVEGSIEDRIRLERGFYARRYLLGRQPPLANQGGRHDR